MSNARSNSVTIFDARTHVLLATIPVGAVPVGIQMSPDGRRAFIANTNDDKVTVLSIHERKVEKSLPPRQRAGRDGVGDARSRSAR